MFFFSNISLWFKSISKPKWRTVGTPPIPAPRQCLFFERNENPTPATLRGRMRVWFASPQPLPLSASGVQGGAHGAPGAVNGDGEGDRDVTPELPRQGDPPPNPSTGSGWSGTRWGLPITPHAEINFGPEALPPSHTPQPRMRKHWKPSSKFQFPAPRMANPPRGHPTAHFWQTFFSPVCV